MSDSELIIVQFYRLGYDDYPIGSAVRKPVGPFNDRKQAYRWIDEKFPINKVTYRRDNLMYGVSPVVESLEMEPPE